MVERARFIRLSAVLVLVLVFVGIVGPWLPVAAAQGDDSGVVSETEYESPQFDFTVEWEESWQVAEDATESAEDDNFDLLTLDSDLARVQIFATNAAEGASAEQGIEGLIDLYAEDFEAFEVLDQAGDEDVAAAVVTYEVDGIPVLDYTEVRFIDRRDVVLTVTLFTPANEFEQQLDDAQEAITVDGDPIFSALDQVDLDAEGDADTETETETATETETEEPRAEDEDEDEITPQFRGGLARTGEQPGPAPENEPEILWTFETGDDFGSLSPAVADDRIFFGPNALYTVDRESGEEVSSIEEDVGFPAPMAVADGIVYAAYEGGAIYAYDPEADEVLWEFATGGESLIGGSPLVSEGIVYTSTFNGFVFAIDAESGEEVWNFRIGLSGAPLTLVDDVLYVPGGGTAPAVMYAFEPESGELLWSAAYGDDTTYGSSAVVDETIYVGNSDGSLYALSTDDGDEIWSVDLGDGENFPVSPAVVDGVVYVDTGETLYALNADDGEELWTAELSATISMAAVVVDDTIIVGDESGTLYALDASQEGEELWSVELDGAIEGSPVVLDGVIYVDSAGTLYALSEE